MDKYSVQLDFGYIGQGDDFKHALVEADGGLDEAIESFVEIQYKRYIDAQRILNMLRFCFPERVKIDGYGDLIFVDSDEEIAKKLVEYDCCEAWEG